MVSCQFLAQQAKAMVVQTATMMCKHVSICCLDIKRRGITQMLQPLHDIMPSFCFFGCKSNGFNVQKDWCVPHMQLLVQTVLADLALKILISSEVPRLQLVCLPVLVVGGTLRALMTAY